MSAPLNDLFSERRAGASRPRKERFREPYCSERSFDRCERCRCSPARRFEARCEPKALRWNQRSRAQCRAAVLG
jgi:hypothetical protein